MMIVREERMTDENRGASAASGRNAKRVRLIRVCAVVFFAFAGKAVSRRHPVLRTHTQAHCVTSVLCCCRARWTCSGRRWSATYASSKFSLSFTNKSVGTVLDLRHPVAAQQTHVVLALRSIRTDRAVPSERDKGYDGFHICDGFSPRSL